MIAILTALEEEILTLRSGYSLEERRWADKTYFAGEIEGVECVVASSGVGKVLSAAAAQHLITAYEPSCLILTGLAGSINPEIHIGDVVVARDLVQHDIIAESLGFRRGQIPLTEIFEVRCDPRLIALASRVHTLNSSVHLGRILTGDQFISHHQRPAYLREELAGDAVEMEGASVGLVCQINKVPFLVIRVISDEANEHAAVNFSEFLPRASESSSEIVRHVLHQLPEDCR